MNVGDPTRKIPAFEEIYSRGTGRRGIQKTEDRRQKTEDRKQNSASDHMQAEIQTISDWEVR
jgi:hypothetical protein